MNNQGWVSIHRKILNSDLWVSEKFTKGQAWIDLILLANREPHILTIRGNDVEIQIGQVGWSEDSLASRWSWSRMKVRRFKLWLKRYNRIDYTTNKVLGVITILNYTQYQNIEQQTIQQTIQQKDIRRYTNNKDNKEDNIKDIYEKKKNLFSKTLINQEIDYPFFYNLAVKLNIMPTPIILKYFAMLDMLKEGTFKSKWGKDMKLILNNWIKRDVSDQKIETNNKYEDAKLPFLAPNMPSGQDLWARALASREKEVQNG
jgi:hypothetical protein